MSITHLTNNSFDNEIKDGKVLVDFYAEWCGPCKMIAPLLEEISEERTDIKIIKVNVDEFSDLAQKYGIMSIPTMIIFNNGKEVNKSIGFMPKDEILNFIDNN